MKYVITLTPGSGIGSVVIGLINALAYMKINDISDILYININKASSPGNVLFTCFLDLEKLDFIKIIDRDIEVILNEKTNRHQVITSDEYVELWYTLETTQDYDFNLKCQIFDSLWLLKPDVVKLLAIETENYSEIDLCINIRRGDKVTLEQSEKQGSIDEYIDAIELVENVSSIFHTSDDYSTFLDIKHKRPDWNLITFCTPKDNGYFLKDLNDNNEPEMIVNHVRKFIKELEIMKKSKYFIGTRTTNVGLMVEIMRKGINIKFIY